MEKTRRRTRTLFQRRATRAMRHRFTTVRTGPNPPRMHVCVDSWGRCGNSTIPSPHWKIPFRPTLLFPFSHSTAERRLPSLSPVRRTTTTIKKKNTLSPAQRLSEEGTLEAPPPQRRGHVQRRQIGTPKTSLVSTTKTTNPSKKKSTTKRKTTATSSGGAVCAIKAVRHGCPTWYRPGMSMRTASCGRRRISTRPPMT